MNVLNNDIKNKIKKFYNQKNYSKLENLLEKLENFDELPVSFLMIYAVSKALNPKSKISDYKISAHYFEKIYRNNEKNLEPLYNLIIVSLKAKRFLNLNNILENVYLSNKKDLKILEGFNKGSKAKIYASAFNDDAAKENCPRLAPISTTVL